MKYDYFSFKLAETELTAEDNDIEQVMVAGSLALFCTLHFDTDPISDTYNHWICTLEVISDTEDYPERCLVLYPNTLHFEGDALYTVAVSSNLSEFTHADLPSIIMTIGVVSNE